MPLFIGGYPYYDYGDGSLDADQPQPQDQTQPQETESQQPIASVSAQQVPSPREADSEPGAGQSAAPGSPAPESTARDTGQLLLVRKDGRVLFVTAYSVVGTQLRYITPEGIMHKFSLADLDSGATEQMNEARGNTVQINN